MRKKVVRLKYEGVGLSRERIFEKELNNDDDKRKYEKCIKGWNVVAMTKVVRIS